MHSMIYRSPIGPLWLITDGIHLTGLWMKDPGNTIPDPTITVLQDTCRWLDAYFRGEQPQPESLPLSPAGTDFQRHVWDILLRIPYGKTRTYGDIAKELAFQLGKEKMSAQAVGGAVGRNPISIIIPCHRWMGAGNVLTGYAWGIEKKAWLLRHEEDHI